MFEGAPGGPIAELQGALRINVAFAESPIIKDFSAAARKSQARKCCDYKVQINVQLLMKRFGIGRGNSKRLKKGSTFENAEKSMCYRANYGAFPR